MDELEGPQGKQPGKKSFWETVPGILTALAAIITAVGTLLTALAATGVLDFSSNPPQLTLTPTIEMSTPSPGATASHTPELITITLINNDCFDSEFYVDGDLVATVPAESQVEFQTTPGSHTSVACYAANGSCGETASPNWMRSTTWSILRSEGCSAAVASPTSDGSITVTLVNNDCYLYDFYVDDQLVTAIAANSQAEFQTSPGLHTSVLCYADTGNCGLAANPNWISSTDWPISRSASCAPPTGELITVSLMNLSCPIQDFYIDNRLFATVDQGESVEFAIPPGSHSTHACSSGTAECGEPLAVDWTESLSWSITCE